MTKPDPVQHMMTWGAATSCIILILYFLLIGSLTLTNLSWIGILLAVGIFGGFTLGGMSGVIIGAAFKHNQDSITQSMISNRRNTVVFSVALTVLFITRILLVLAFGIIGHPLVLSLIAAIAAAFASQHYLYRMEHYLKRTKRKRKPKNDELPQRLMVEDQQEPNIVISEQAQQHTSRRR